MTALLEKDFSPSEFTLFSEILWKLGSGKGQYNLRENIIADIAILLRADFAASYIKTGYYNEFLKTYGLYHGINIYFVRNGMDIGDLRIWRAQDAEMFGEREKRILTLLEPYFTQALPLDLSTQYSLTPREQEVVHLVSKGLSDKEVANLLGIGFTTLRTHLNNSMRKIGCNNRTEMALLIQH